MADRMASTGRDLRLDFFRGLGLLFIFLDHIPNNIVSYFTLANIVFSDAAEIFVFISGYSAALVFGEFVVNHGPAYAMAQVLKRCWTLYVAHIFLFVLFVAQVSYTATKFDNPMFLDEMKVADFLQEPHLAILQAIALRLQPNFLDILPLYIVLLLGFTALLPLLRTRTWIVIAAAFVLYAVAALSHINLSTYPEGTWYFNPLTWQMLFLLGAAFAMQRDSMRSLTANPTMLWVSLIFLSVCVVVRTTMTVADLLDRLPPPFIEAVWMIADKTNLGPLRLLNFLALVHVTVWLLRRDHPLFQSSMAEPVVLCGQYSLNIFCLGIFLSFVGHFVLVEINRGLAVQVAVSAAGILIMFASAYFLAWSKQRRRPAGVERPVPATSPQAVVQGGE